MSDFPRRTKQGDSQTRSLLFSDYNDWYRLRSLLLRLSEWEMGGTAPYISAGDLQVAGEYANRLNDVDCTYTLAEVKAMGWMPPGDVALVAAAHMECAAQRDLARRELASARRILVSNVGEKTVAYIESLEARLAAVSNA